MLIAKRSLRRNGERKKGAVKLVYLVDVGRANDDELVVGDHHLGVHVDHRTPALLALLLRAARLGRSLRLRFIRLLYLPANNEGACSRFLLLAWYESQYFDRNVSVGTPPARCQVLKESLAPFRLAASPSWHRSRKNSYKISSLCSY